ncbi:similar to conserved hypothetical protein [Rhizoctonia solani]|uniref:Transposase family Tnp2 protein n=1 Tax=Rhizoctonia solani TaxID=456999 RepID=A0A0K6G425_9AGAM|nr:similar to conserved hypothetical protein [Rhizoctonia solani]
MKEIMRGQQPGHDDQGPQEPSTRQEWLDSMPENRRFGAMSEGWGWKSQHARMTREYDLQERRYHDLEPEDGPVSLVSLPNGLSLTIFFDGIQAHEHQKYEVQAVYITVNNIPSHLRALIENIILVIVIPGPNQPTAYELDQILEPLVDELLELEQGVEMQVYDQNTRRMVRETVYARLSLGVLDYIARLKLTGHAGVASEDHFCLYCTKKLSQLSVRDGYQDIDLRNPSVHLQRKHEWLRAQGDPVEQERLRKRYGTIFTELDRLPGWYAPTSCPIDGMHLFDLGMTKRLYKDIIFRPGLLQHRRGQPEEERPVARFEAFIKRTYFPSHCSRLPPKLAEAKGRIKAEQWRNMAHILHVALFEAWRVGDAIPNTDIPRGGTRTKIYAEQNKMAEHLYAARCRVHADEGGAEEDEPSLDDCRPSRNPRDYYKVVLCYLVARNILFSWQHSLAEVEFAQQLLWRVNTSLVDMNVPLPPTAHLLMHLEEHIQKYGSLYGKSTNAFERANKVLVGTNTNGRGSGCMEETMARGFWQRADFFRLIRRMQAIPNPTRDDTATIEVMLRAVRNAPEHEVQRGLLDQVLAGEIPFQAQGDFSHVHHAGFRFGSDSHYRGKCSRYGYVKEGLHGRTPALVKMIYKVCLTTPDDNVEHSITCAIVQRFVPPEHRPQFPWHHWQSRLGTGSWCYNVLQEPEAIPIDHLVGVFALSDITMAGVRYWLTFSMDHSEPEPLED